MTQETGGFYWEHAYAAATTLTERAIALATAVEVCDACPITTECADLAELSGYTGIAGGRAYRNGRPDTYRGPRRVHTA